MQCLEGDLRLGDLGGRLGLAFNPSQLGFRPHDLVDGGIEQPLLLIEPLLQFSNLSVPLEQAQLRAGGALLQVPVGGLELDIVVAGRGFGFRRTRFGVRRCGLLRPRPEKAGAAEAGDGDDGDAQETR